MKGNKGKDCNQMQEGKLLSVEIKVVTWGKDSHGLFDYESKSLIQKKFFLDNTTHFFRDSVTSNVQIKSVDQQRRDKAPNSELPLLAEIVRRDGPQSDARFFFRAEKPAEPGAMEIEPQSEKPYLIVRSLKNKENQQKGYPLEIGDVIKLGRIEYVVSELKTAEQTLSNRKSDTDQQKVYEVHENLSGQCKICLGEEETQENFFVSPCSCKGSCSIVHILCLKRWIESKMVVKQHQIAISYNFTKFECEICKDPYPKIIRRNDVGHELFVLKRPNTPYIMLEGLQQQSKQNKTMYLISAINPGEVIKLGRGHQCEIRVTDISVSRQHAHIKYDNQKFYIFDNNSKFGTLIGLHKDMPIRNEKIAVQIGRTVITFALKTEEAREKIARSSNTLSGQMLPVKK